MTHVTMYSYFVEAYETITLGSLRKHKLTKISIVEGLGAFCNK